MVVSELCHYSVCQLNLNQYHRHSETALLRNTHFLALVFAAILLSGCATHANYPSKAKPTYFVYLAGPEVFLPDPIGAGEHKKALIQKLNQKNNWPFNLVGLYPMDNEIENFGFNFETGMNIYHANIELMDQAHFITANMVRFRGPSMDVGTAFEMGYMAGLNKPVFAYYDAAPFYGEAEQAGLYVERVKKYYPVSPTDDHKDIHGQTIESFNMADNLMMVGSLESGNGKIAENFQLVIEQIAEHILANRCAGSSCR